MRGKNHFVRKFCYNLDNYFSSKTIDSQLIPLTIYLKLFFGKDEN